MLDPLDATVSRVDPRRGAVVATVPLGGAPAALTQSGGNIWIADGRDGSLLRVDPRREAVTRFRLAGRPSALIAAGGSLWAAAGAAGASHRGGTLTSINSYAAIDTIDPAASTSPNVAPPQLFGLTNDGLVTLNHASGPAGTRLVPDLALALPVPAANGRTYTFRLRPGIRYSTGTLVTPTDITRSFERLFQLGSSGTAYPSADDFLGKLTCTHFTPGNGQATTDASELCDPALDNQIARAAQLQTTDPPAAAALWARLDHQLTNLAIWLPTVTPNETDLISARTGNYQYNPVWGALIDQLQVR